MHVVDGWNEHILTEFCPEMLGTHFCVLIWGSKLFLESMREKPTNYVNDAIMPNDARASCMNEGLDTGPIEGKGWENRVNTGPWWYEVLSSTKNLHHGSQYPEHYSWSTVEALGQARWVWGFTLPPPRWTSSGHLFFSLFYDMYLISLGPLSFSIIWE